MKTRVPLVTLVLIAANLAVAFVAPFSAFTENFAFDPQRPTLLSALTCLFLHDPQNILHLLGNLVFLAAVGPLVEQEVGPAKFAFVYLVSGLVGVGSHWLVSVNAGIGTPLIGASSAIAGCVGYCTVRFSRRRVPVLPKVQVDVAWLAIVWVVLQVFGALVNFGEGGTSYIAHIGGFIGGVILAFVLRAQVAASAEQGRAHIEAMAGRSPAAALAAAEAMLRKHPGDPVALWERAAALHAMGDREDEAKALADLVRRGHDVERAVDCLSVINGLRVLTPLERMRLATTMNGFLKKELYESVANERDTEPERPNALLALLELSDDKDDRERYAYDLTHFYTLHAATDVARKKGLLK